MNNAAATTRATKTSKTVTIVEPRDRDRTQFGRPVPGSVLEGHTVTVVPGKCITLAGTTKRTRAEKNPETGRYEYTPEMVPFFNHFRIGDVAEVGSFNLVYTGIVRKITSKTVTVVEYEGHQGMEKTYVFSIYRFAQKNWDFDREEAAERNANWMD